MLCMKEEVDNQDVQHLKEVFICTTLNIERVTHSNKQYNICAQTYHTYSQVDLTPSMIYAFELEELN